MLCKPSWRMMVARSARSFPAVGPRGCSLCATDSAKRTPRRELRAHAVESSALGDLTADIRHAAWSCRFRVSPFVCMATTNSKARRTDEVHAVDPPGHHPHTAVARVGRAARGAEGRRLRRVQ